MENSLDIILLLNDASVAWCHPLETASGDQKFHSHSLMQGEALFRYKHYDRLFLHRESPKAPTSLEQELSQTITFCGNFRLCLMPPFLSVSARSTARFENYRHHQCQKISHPKREFS